MAAPSKPLETEVAHILFMDIVGYSRLSMEEQARLDAELLQVVRESPEFQSAEIQIPAGDGMALVFFGDPRAPAQCALEIAHALRDRPDLPLRMGIHIGPVSRSTLWKRAPPRTQGRSVTICAACAPPSPSTPT